MQPQDTVTAASNELNGLEAPPVPVQVPAAYPTSEFTLTTPARFSFPSLGSAASSACAMLSDRLAARA